MKVIIGLGNPENKYDNTRHNIGFMAVNHYVKFFAPKFQHKDNYYYVKEKIANEDVIFVKPDTYMNNSGQALKKISSYFQVELKDILVIYDDIDLTFGTLKLKLNSSAGSHNGMKSIIEHMGTKEIFRLKLGIDNGRPKDLKKYVLGSFSKSEQKFLNEDFFIKTDQIIDAFIKGQTVNEIMNEFN